MYRAGTRIGPPIASAAPAGAATALLVLLLVASGCGDARGAGSPSITDVQVELDPDGSGSRRPGTARLSCPSEAHPVACRRLERLGAWVFAPVRRHQVCTMRFGGRQVGRIRGLVDGRLVDARFSRRNGCEIRRYAAVAPILKLARLPGRR